MLKLANVDIENRGDGTAKVVINGMDFSDQTTKVTYEFDANDRIPLVTVTLACDVARIKTPDCNVETEAEWTLTRDSYLKLLNDHCDALLHLNTDEKITLDEKYKKAVILSHQIKIASELYRIGCDSAFDEQCRRNGGTKPIDVKVVKTKGD